MGFESCVKEAGCCFLKVALDVFEKRKYSGSFSEKIIILSEATRLIISRGESLGVDEESLIANEIATLYRRRTGTWYLNSTHDANDDSQTPCTFDETLLQKRLAASTTTARYGVKSILKSLGLEKAFNYLINEMKSLISGRCE